MPGADFLATRQRHYADILNDLFDPPPHMESHRLFEFICALVRAGGLELGGIDPWYESRAIIADLRNLSSLELPADRFPHPAKTQVRLALLAYCTLTEMDLPYMLLANLLRLRIGNKYHIDPFHDLAKQRKPSKGHPFGTLVPPTTNQKLKRITELAQKANMSSIGAALEEVHDSVIRNAVYHSDFVLQDDSFLIRKASRLSKKEGGFTPRVALEELDELITNAFALYSALFSLYERCLNSFGDSKEAFIPYDSHYKGVMEFLFEEEDRLIGFRIYWPNGACGEYARTKEACVNMNLSFDQDGSINFMVGLIASQRGPFSPLVEHGTQPNYAFKPSTQLRPHWPDDLRPYKLS
ncbi:MAG: hypothetical protein ABI833_17505 [Acidobacteriota bacterium]